jgi:hypothetical protein
MGLDAGSRPICASDPRVLSRVGAPYAPGFTSFRRLLISPRMSSLQPLTTLWIDSSAVSRNS